MTKHSSNFHIKFILLSSSALALFVIFAFFVLPAVLDQDEQSSEAAQNEKFYLNEKYKKTEDPLLTTIPQLNDMITGPIITDADPDIGPENASVNIVAYTDFECSYCYKAVQDAKKIQAEIPETIKFIHKDFPVDDESSASFQAALAGRCAQ